MKINTVKLILLIIFMLVIIRKILIEYLVCLVSKNMSEKISLINIKDFENKVQKISNQVKNSNNKIRLKRSNTSHLFGLKILDSKNTIDLTKFNQIIEFNPKKKFIRVGGNTNLLELILFLKENGYGLKVIPDMDHLTIGGLYAGIGGGARTFKCGAFFNSVMKVEIVTGNGEILLCDENQNSEMFKLLPSTLGSLGYALSLWLEIEQIKKYVFSETYQYDNFEDFLHNIKKLMKDTSIDFLDGTIFNPKKFVIIIGKQTNQKSSYKLYGKKLGIPYYEMVEKGYKGIFEYYDFIYRWDVDGYYSFIGDEWYLKLLRNKYARKLLDKRLFTETKLRNLAKIFGINSVDSKNQIKAFVGDFMIPIDNSLKYYKWFEEQGNDCYPIYICPINFKTKSPFIKTDKISIDFGIGYGVDPKNMSRDNRVSYLRKCMLKAYELNGDMLKYNSIYKNSDEFWKFYPKELKSKYHELKNKYDKKGNFYSIADKLSLEEHKSFKGSE